MVGNQWGTFSVRSDGFSVAVTFQAQQQVRPELRRGTCSIDCYGDSWMVSRCLVQPDTARSAGMGSFMLQRAVQAVLERDPAATIEVVPGGYGSDPAAQNRFYERNGFSKDTDGVHRYRGPRESAAEPVHPRPGEPSLG